MGRCYGSIAGLCLLSIVINDFFDFVDSEGSTRFGIPIFFFIVLSLGLQHQLCDVNIKGAGNFKFWIAPVLLPLSDASRSDAKFVSQIA